MRSEPTPGAPPDGLVADAVGVRYTRGRASTDAVAGCSFVVPEGRRASIIGPSGCGKSTMLRVFADIVPPAAGRVTIGGLTPHDARRARSFGLVSQESVMLEWRSVLDNVALGLEIVGVGRRERRRRATEAIELVGLHGFETAYPHELSGGMRQRAAIARSLVLEPRYLLMDEPFGALDELTRQRLNFELLRILAETSATLLLVTHSITEAVILSDEVFVMSPRPGRITHRVPIDLGRERTAAVRDDPRFVDLESRLRHCLDDQAATPVLQPTGASR